MERLADMAVASLRAQVEAGAQAVQLFDSWAGSLSPTEYRRFALPATRAVLAGARRPRRADASSSGSAPGELLGLMATSGADVVGVDWRVPLDEARRRVGPDRAMQGNLDPALCLAPWPVVEERDARRCSLERGAADASARARLQPRARRAARDRPGDPRAVVDLVHAETAGVGRDASASS